MTAQRGDVQKNELLMRCSEQSALNGAASAFENTAFEKTDGGVVIVNAHSLILDCLTEAISSNLRQPVECFRTIADWMFMEQPARASLLVLCQLGLSKGEAISQVENVAKHVKGCYAILLSDREDPDFIVEVLRKKIRGYIPTSLSLSIAIQAMRFVLAGGVFVPASSLMVGRGVTKQASGNEIGNAIFTARQASVVEAIRHGKPNKIIAHELNMKESTVKVHVRNIMKKLQATNRTQVAYMANRLLNGD